MTRFSANLGFLWTELSLPDAVRAAADAGFDAVECHWPYDTKPADLRRALMDTGLPLLGLNTVRGKPGENGLAALPGREADARAAIDQAIGYAADTGAHNVHVMAGFSGGPRARDTFLSNLAYGAEAALRQGVKILIEPLNPYDAPGYYLRTTDQARDLIAALSMPNVKLMFDCYHVQVTEGDVSRRLTALLPLIGHVQIAAAPDRGAPDHGELYYPHIYAHLAELGYDKPLGAEYKPNGPTEATLGWLASARQALGK